MKRIIFAILLVCSTARAQVWIGGTNEISGITGPLIYTNFVAGQFRVTVGALDGGSPIDLSGDRVSLQVQDTRDGKLVVSNTCMTIDAYTYRGEGSLSASPAPYTLKVQVYPDANPDAFYPIYWASLTITSSPSASATYPVSLSLVPLIPSNGTIGTEAYPWAEFNAQTGRVGKLIAQNLDVSGAITAIDTGRVSKLGDTMFAPLTNEHGYFGNGIGMSNLQWSAIEGAPTIPDLSDAVTNSGATINGQAVTNGAAITIAAGGLPVAVDQYGKVGYSNAAGDFITLEGQMPATGATIHCSFETSDDLTNFYYLNWGVYTAEVVRGRLVVSASVESVDQTRAMAVFNPATNTACSMTVKLVGSSVVGPSANQHHGIGMGVSMSNSWAQFRERVSGDTRQLRGYYNNLTSAGSFATGGTSTYPSDPNAYIEAFTIEQFPIYLGADHDGVLTLRYFAAKDNGFGQPARWMQIASKTNAPPGSYWGMVFSSPTYSQGSPSWVLDDFTFTSGSLLK